MTYLPEALRLIRLFHDKTQDQLAKDINISKSYLSEIESGKKNINMELLNKYSQAFDIPISSIIIFSERLEANTISENARTFVANKIIKLMKWLTDEEQP